ncbi:hypothetical protein K8I61_05370, partial [bacterium]|nr:hypothetical protein [bacterium]
FGALPEADVEGVDLFGEAPEEGEIEPPAVQATPADEEAIDVFGETPPEEAGEAGIPWEGEPDIFAEEGPAATVSLDEEALGEAAEPDLFAGEEGPAATVTVETGEEADLFADEAEAEPPAAAPEREGDALVGEILGDIFGDTPPPSTATEDETDILNELLAGLTDEGPAQGDLLEAMTREFRDLAGGEDTQDARAHFDLGIAFREMDQMDEAIAELEKALALGGHDIARDGAIQLAQCYMEREDWRNAAGYIESALEEMLEGESADENQKLDLLMDLGQAYARLGEKRRALRALHEVDELSANYRGVKELIKKIESGTDGDDNISYM